MAAVTLKHVAEKVGVDRSTVSRVLRDKGSEIGISRQLAERIKAAAAELHYTPNASARAIRCGRTGAAALLMSTVAGRSYLPSPLLDGLHDELAVDDLHLTIAKVGDEKLSEQDAVPKVFREFMVDGVLINYTHHLPPRLLEAVESAALPTVWLNADLKHDGINAANRAAAERATKRLIELGHRRIVYLDLCHGARQLAEAHHSARDRLEGYEAAMRQADLKPIEWRPTESPDSPATEERFMLDRLRRTPRPTAVLSYFSISLPPIWRACAELGLRVPRDVSLMSFAPELWHDAGVNVDCLLEPHYAMGRAAGAMLRERITNPRRRLPSRELPFEPFNLGTVAPL